MTDHSWDFETNRSPSSPPARPSSTSHVIGPPTAPITVVGVPSPATATPPPSRWGWRALGAFVAGGLLASAGFGAAQLSDRFDDDPVVVTPTIRASDAPLVVGTDDPGDPASVVATVLGPSVVQIETDIGLGSGVIFGDGLIVTNNHVIEGATAVAVRLSDGRTLSATVVGADPRTDVAVVAAGKGLGLPIADLAIGQQLEVGELTVAIGSPFDLQQTVTLGIVSALNRPIYNGVGWNAMVQTDAAINPGNSGGALANRAGQVIGINTAIQTDGQSATNAGIGFAMPITTVAHVAERIIGGDSLEPGFLGVRGEEPADGQVGVEIKIVEPSSAAEGAGLRVGDIVRSINGAPVTAFEELAGLIQTGFPGEDVELEVLRNGETLKLVVTLGQR